MCSEKPRFRISILVGVTLMVFTPTAAQFSQRGGKLVGLGAVGNASQGYSVSLSADGNTAIVGGPSDNSDTGAAWVYTRSGGVWTQQGNKLVGTGAVGAARQGSSVSLSADGNTAIVGGIYDSSYTGAAWVYTRSGDVWTQQGGKLVGTGAVDDPHQGYSVSLSGDGNTAIVGGWEDSSLAGAAWVYARSGGVWTQQGSKLVGTGAVGTAHQGVSVGLSADGNTAIVGGYGDSTYSGAAWVYVRNSGVWTQQGSKLVGTGAVGVLVYQGVSVSISADGNTAIVGGHGDSSDVGAAWVYTRSGEVWTQQGSKLVGTGAVGTAAQGASVSLSADGNTAIVGGLIDSSDVGAAWVYTRSGDVWTQQGSKLVGTGADGSTVYQGRSVFLSADGNTVIVGGYGDNSYQGAVWFYVVSGGPEVVGVADVVNDQGGQVRVAWNKSAYDNPLSNPQISSYSIWRRAPNGSMTSHGFDYLTTLPALQIPDYQIVVPTLEDSTSSGIPYHTFVVLAHTTELDLFYSSDFDSGYSVDNLSPIPPAGLVASIEPGSEVALTWDSPTDPDVGHYNIYRSETSGFMPEEGNKIGTSNSTSFTDVSPITGSPSYYKIIAVDIHDNPSPPSNEAEAAVTVNRQFSVTEKWNIVSVPLTMNDYTKVVLFPSASTNAFTFEDGYVAYGTLENGRGYWMKFSGNETIFHDGLERREDTVSVQAGWNMVGSLSSSIAATTVSSIPGGIVTSSFFKYDNGYSASSTIDPGRGYWVKSSQAGQLVMSSIVSATPANRIRIENTGEQPPPPPDEVNSEIPDDYSLEQNYPNPFNPVTSIGYGLPATGHVRLVVYNMVGQEVAVLVDGTEEAGYKTVSFDASSLPSGVYTYRITSGSFSDVRKMMLLK